MPQVRVVGYRQEAGTAAHATGQQGGGSDPRTHAESFRRRGWSALVCWLSPEPAAAGGEETIRLLPRLSQPGAFLDATRLLSEVLQSEPLKLEDGSLEAAPPDLILLDLTGLEPAWCALLLQVVWNRQSSTPVRVLSQSQTGPQEMVDLSPWMGSLDGQDSEEPAAEPAPAVTEAPPSAPPSSMSPGEGLERVEEWASWSQGEAALRETQEELLRQHPELEEELQRRRERGRQQLTLLGQLEKLLQHHPPEFPECQRVTQELLPARRSLDSRISSMLAWAHSVHQRRKTSRERLASKQLLSAVRPRHSHRIDQIAPSNQWVLLTCPVFAAGGRFSGRPCLGQVALIAPEVAEWSRHLDPDKLTASHEIDAYLNTLLNDPQVGILGLQTRSPEQQTGAHEIDALLEISHWVLRLLPLGDQAEVRVRLLPIMPPDRGAAGLLQRGLECLSRRLYQEDPDRGRRVRLSVDTEPRALPAWRHPLKLLVRSWESNDPEDQDRLMRSGLLQSCLHTGNTEVLERCWMERARWGRISPASWSALLRDPQVHFPDTLPGSLLRALAADGQTARVWREYRRDSSIHLQARARSLEQIGRESRWLMAHRPAGASLPAGLELAAFLSSEQLPGLPHNQTRPLEREIDTLSERLQLEDARQACVLDLQRAQQELDLLQLDSASVRLRTWLSVDPRIPGARLHDAILLQLARHSGLRGDYKKALQLIERIEHAQSKRPGGASPSLKLSCYKAFCLMELALLSQRAEHALAARRVVESITGPLQDVTNLVSWRRRPIEAQHLMVRWICELGNSEERETYLRSSTTWESSDSVMGRRISMYRGILLHHAGTRSASREWLTQAWEQSLQVQDPCEGALLALSLGAAIRVSAPSWEWPQGPELLAQVERLLPLTRRQLNALKSAMRRPTTPSRWLRHVLPFDLR